jgi:flagellar motor switch protein FliN/FliY
MSDNVKDPSAGQPKGAEIPLSDLEAEHAEKQSEDLSKTRSATELEAVFDVPVKVSAILGRAKMQVAELLKLQTGNVIELDRKVGEAVDIYVNNRLVARGEVVLVNEKLGVTMTEIIKSEK